MATPLEAIQGIPNAHSPAPNLVTGGQPMPSHLEALAAAGGKVVLDIRDSMEPRPFDEPALVRQLGMEYINVSVTAGNLDDSTLERILTVVRANADRPMLFHCASGNRVGGALIPFFMRDLGLTEEQAVESAMRVGLRGADLLQWGLAYAERSA